jgi:putative ABC transport system permease protein
MKAMIADALAQERFVALLLSLFAGVALILAAVGLFGIVAYNVTCRTREMGLRMALGADGSRIGRLVVGRSMALGLGGLAVGLAGALLLTRFMEGLLFGVTRTDPGTLVITVLLLLAVAVLASAVPAWRASRVDPAQVLKAD